MTLIAKKEFRSELVRETSHSSTPLGEYDSTMELHGENDNYYIEWDIPDLETTECIGIFVDEGTRTISDYDGVFEVPKQAIELLEENGFDCSYLKN